MMTESGTPRSHKIKGIRTSILSIDLKVENNFPPFVPCAPLDTPREPRGAFPVYITKSLYELCIFGVRPSQVTLR